MQLFFLQRHRDISGISGLGKVAEGCILSNGKCLIGWLSGPSVSIHESLEAAQHIHGHNGATQFIFQFNKKEQQPRLLYLQHTKDISELSGIGIVAELVEFSNGFIGLQWLKPPFQIEVFATKSHFNYVHSSLPHSTVVQQFQLSKDKAEVALAKTHF